MSKEQKLYNELVEQCKKANDLIDKGYILLDEDNDIYQGKFVFTDRKNSKSYIALHKEGSNCWLMFVYENNSPSIFGMNTTLEEYQECKKHLEKYKLIPVENTISFFDIK